MNSNFYEQEINFMPPLPKTQEVACPSCHRVVRFAVFEDRILKDHNEMLKDRINVLTEEFKKIDEWCVKNIGDTYTASLWREFREELRRKYGKQGEMR